MRVAVDARVLTVQSELAGVGQYIHEMVQQSQKTPNDGVSLVPLSFQSNPRRPYITVVKPIARLPWQSFAIPWHLFRQSYDVFHGPAFSVPPLTRVPLVATIHDVTYLRYPETVNDDTRHYLSRVVPGSMARCDAIIVPSREVKEDLIRYFPKTPTSKIRVIPLGADRLPLEGPRHEIGHTFPYILHVGTVEPRKNLEFLLRAFERLKERFGVPHHLVLLGGSGWKNQGFHQTLDGLPHRDAVHLMGYVDDETMAEYYRRASLYTMPAVYEGFGIGAVEAARFGVPVLANATGGIRDLPEDMGIRLLTNFDADLWAESMADMLVHAGSPQLSVPTWHQTWMDHVALYQEVAED